MRTKKLLLNSLTSLLLQLVTIICGFILGRVILVTFGSEINGAVSSITQFLGYISLLEVGIGGVTRAALYKPLAEGNTTKISGIINATQAFFRKIALVFCVYVVFLVFSFKYISQTELDFWFVAALVLILAINTFAQYYFGITYSVLINADQREYINNLLNTVTLIINAVICVILINTGASIHIVKAASVGVYIFRPILLYVFARRRYNIIRCEKTDDEAIKQRWNGFGHHIAYYIHNNIDVMVVTVLLGLKWASVYAVYYMVVSGVRKIVVAFSGGTEAALGNMIARDESDILNSRFKMVENMSSMISVTMFSVTGLLLFDFIGIYTSGVGDIEYVIYSVGILMVVSEALHSLKQTYHHAVMAAGHYKQTQVGAFIEAGLNVFLSIILALFLGLSGVILATIIATTYRIVDYVLYLRKNILNRRYRDTVKRFAVNGLNAILIIVVVLIIPFSSTENYLEWVLKAIPVFIISCMITLAVNYIFYKKDFVEIVKRIMSIFARKKEVKTE